MTNIGDEVVCPTGWRNISCGANRSAEVQKEHAIRAGEGTGRELGFAPNMAKPAESDWITSCESTKTQ